MRDCRLRENLFHDVSFSISFPGDASYHWRRNGAQDESTAIKSSQHVARSSASQQIITSKYSQVSLISEAKTS